MRVHCDIYFNYIDELKSLHRAFNTKVTFYVVFVLLVSLDYDIVTRTDGLFCYLGILHIPSTGHWLSVWLMLGHRLRRWPNIYSTESDCGICRCSALTTSTVHHVQGPLSLPTSSDKSTVQITVQNTVSPSNKSDGDVVLQLDYC